ncbi:MAG TPA: hypothetical protein VJY33_21820, partial [Isosphaeraceae bacterium]|nr:hypothetical protein [Isosphaeraceae bacterium]
GVAADSNGNLWVTETAANTVQEVSPAGGILATVALTGAAVPEGITLGPDGNMYVAEFGTNAVEEISPTTHALVGAPIAVNAGPEGITSAGGSLWVTNSTADTVQEISPATHGLAATIGGLTAGAAPTGITAGPNNTVWFTETGAGVNDIGEINTAAPALITATVLATSGKVNPANYVPVGIAEGSDGNIWFTMQVTAAGAGLGRLPRIGVIHSSNTLVVNSENISAGPGAANWVPVSTTAGPDGNVWFTMRNTAVPAQPDRIGVVQPTTSVINSAALPVGTFLAANDTLPFGIYGLSTPDPPATSAPLMNRSNSLLASG